MVAYLDGDGGMFDAATLEAALRDPGDRHQPRSRLVAVEQTTNIGGGRVWPLAKIEEVLAVAARARPPHPPRRRPPAQRDGRLGRRRRRVRAAASTPPGSTSARGSGRRSAPAWSARAELIEEAWRYKQMLGGAMRQAGIVAAGALYALDHNVERLAEDHANARFLAEALARDRRGRDRPGDGRIEHRPLLGGGRATRWSRRSPSDGVEMSHDGPVVRAVTHLDVDRAGVERAAEARRRERSA